MFRTVIGVPRLSVAQAEVGRAVDDHHVLAECGADGSGVAVRKSEKDHVVAGKHLDSCLFDDPVCKLRQMRHELADALAGVGRTGERADL